MSSTDVVITAAGCVAEEGYGSHRSGAGSWDGLPGAVGGSGRPPVFTWSSLFASPCPRFGRMDLLCKLGLASAELMGVDFSRQTPEEKAGTGVCLGTPEGSLSVDVEFWKKRNGLGGPNPALFTYTLPSTLIGEICIRYGLKGPNLCLMLDAADSGRILRESAEWLRGGEAAACVCVFANAVDGDAASAFEAPGDAGRARSFACAAYLERSGDAERRRHPVLRRAPAEGGDMREICEALCGLRTRG